MLFRIFVDVFDLYGSDLLNQAQVVLNYCCLIHFPVPLRHMMLLHIGSSAFNLRNTSTPDGKRQTATIGNPYFLANDLIPQLCTKPGFVDKCNPPMAAWSLSSKRDLFYQDDSNQDAGNPSPSGAPRCQAYCLGLDMGATSNWGWGHLSSKDWGGYMIAHGE